MVDEGGIDSYEDLHEPPRKKSYRGHTLSAEIEMVTVSRKLYEHRIAITRNPNWSTTC